MKRQVLLIASDFFGYYKLISNELTNQGWEVHYLNDRPSTSSLFKILIRKMRFAVSWYLDWYYQDKIKQLGSFDLVLIIKGEGITTSTLKFLKSKYVNTPVHLYLWDGIANSPGALANSKIADKVFSFDPEDCKAFKFEKLPLFYVEQESQKTSGDVDKKYDLSFIGSIHGDRLEVIRKSMASLNDIARTFTFIYFPSRLVFLFRKLFDSNFSFFKTSELSLEPLVKTQAVRIFNESIAALDIHHKNQSGLTMRTLEVLSLGKKLVTTNKSILNYDFYDTNQILVIDRENPSIDISFFSRPSDLNFKTKIKKYELSAWVRTLTQVSE